MPPTEAGSPGRPAELTVAFLGLAGWQGPLPAAYSEWILEREQRHDLALTDFLDLFNRRLLDYFYRGRQKHRLSLISQAPERSRFARMLGHTMGIDPAPAQRAESALPPRTLLRYAGLLADRRRSLAGLTAMLSDFFQGLPVSGRSFVGGWDRLDDSQHNRLTDGRQHGNNRLGTDLLLGRRIWDQHNGIRLDLGPLSFSQFREFLPTGRDFGRLRDLVRFYLGTRCRRCHVLLRLKPAEVPALRLGERRLGWTSWLGGNPNNSPEPEREAQVRLALPLVLG